MASAGLEVRQGIPLRTAQPCFAPQLVVARSSGWLTTRTHRALVIARGAGAGGVIDKPTTIRKNDKKHQRSKRRPPSYRVLLHNDDYNRREYVVQVLLKVVEGFTVEDALNVMQEAHYNGLALVTVCAQDQAEDICEGMRSSGLISTIEPSGPGDLA